MRIELIAEDIADGERGDCSAHPVALAITRRLGFPGVRVGDDVISLYVRGELAWSIKTPPEVVEFIRRFDEGEPVKPFAFDLPIPEAPPCA